MTETTDKIIRDHFTQIRERYIKTWGEKDGRILYIEFMKGIGLDPDKYL